MNVTTAHQEPPLAWAEKHFGEVDLGDLRRNQRAITIATAMARNPDRSIPQMFLNSYDIKAAYTFFRQMEATPDNLQQAHREVVMEQLHKLGRYLLLEDTSEMTWSGNKPVPGLGPIGNSASGLQGFHLHSVLAVRWRWEVERTDCWPGRPAVEVLGLPVQRYRVREPRPKGEAANNSKLVKYRARESQSQAALGEFTLELRARPGQEARTARLQVSAVRVWLRSPQRPGKGSGYLPPVRSTVVRVWEASPPGAEGLEWILLTDWLVDNYAQALEVALVYSTRWLIEEFHKALKTGNRAEELQLETAEALFAAIAIKSVVALRLLDLRERVRLAPDAPAQQAGLDELELNVLRQCLRRPIKNVREVALAIGRLGGHLNRKGDGLPGWQTLLRGMSKLNDLVEGARIALKLKRFG